MSSELLSLSKDIGQSMAHEIAMHRGLIAALMGTAVAAWAGTRAAFKTDLKQRKKDLRSQQLMAANKAVFDISIIHGNSKMLKQVFITPWQQGAENNDPLMLRTPSHEFMDKVSFNFEALGFLLTDPGENSAQSMVELLSLEQAYNGLKAFLLLRANALDDLHQCIRTAKPIANDHNPPQDKCPKEFKQCLEYSEYFVKNVDIVIEGSLKTYDLLRKALVAIFSEDEILTITIDKLGIN